MSNYDLASVELPRVDGTFLGLLADILANPVTGALLRGRLLADTGVIRLRDARFDEPPTFLPLTSDTSAAGGTPMPALDDIRGLRAMATDVTSIRDFAQAYRTGRATPEQVAERLLGAIEDSRRGRRPLGAVVAIDPDDVMSQARAAGARFRAGTPISVLDGVPIGVKDELDQSGYPTSGGTSFFGRVPAAEDATVVGRLRGHGALLFGKLNMNEIGINPNGCNMHHGLVRNPYDRSRDPGGSSSGSAAAVAAGLCPGALGADGGGSIRIPAALCGVVGLKATFGRISEHGALPLCWSVAHVGPLGATVEDVAIQYAAIAGRDPRDPVSCGQPRPTIEGWSEPRLDGMTIGVYEPWFEHADPAIVRTCRAALKALEQEGVSVREIEIPDLDAMRVAHAVIILAEMASSMRNMGVDERSFSAPTRINLALGRSLPSMDYVHAQRVRTRAMASFLRVLADVDAIATPATAITAPRIPVQEAHLGWSDLTSVTELMRFAFPGNLTGLPAIVLPVGYDDHDLPIGLQLMGRPWAEHQLLRLAHALEQRVVRRVPLDYCSLLSS